MAAGVAPVTVRGHRTSPPLLLLLLLLSVVTGGAGIRLLRSEIPRYVAAGQHVPLSCHVLLGWRERIYAVNWYRDGREFYRYNPGEVPAAQVFQQPHIHVDVSGSNSSTVLLRHMRPEASGTYRCEISTEAPLFNTVSRHGRLRVVELPTRGPVISGGRERYRIGDQIQLNCTSPDTVPPPKLTWYIEGERVRVPPQPKLTWYIEGGKAHSDLVTEFPRAVGPGGVVIIIKQLRLVLLDKHLASTGRLNIKCTASLENIYWRSHERHVHEHVEARPARVTGRNLRNGANVLGTWQKWRILAATASLVVHHAVWR